MGAVGGEGLVRWVWVCTVYGRKVEVAAIVCTVIFAML